ncbi:MAG: hypothetical protein DME32_04080 [Verrucomicrobia bacterium]|nr:MAG: hypothetical protein DME32_04080 [Verrucomicrobiota bacterium]
MNAGKNAHVSFHLPNTLKAAKTGPRNTLKNKANFLWRYLACLADIFPPRIFNVFPFRVVSCVSWFIFLKQAEIARQPG